MRSTVILDLTQNLGDGKLAWIRTMRRIVFTLTLDSSPVKGEGDAGVRQHDGGGPSFPAKAGTHRAAGNDARCTVILDLIQNLQGGAENKTTSTNYPLSLDGRGI